VTGDRQPTAVGPLVAVERFFPGDAFAPAIHAVAMCGQQEDAAAAGASKARLEEMDERHMNLAKCNGFNLHLLCFRKALESTTETLRDGEIIFGSRDLIKTCKELFFSVPPRLCGESLLRFIRPILVPTAKQELSVARSIALVT
jgi:hypothetical protein